MKEIVIISGKGGTGKTSLTASLATLARNSILADCDVDAPDLHLIMKPQVKERHPFISGNLARIRTEDCTGCGICYRVCRFEAISGSFNTGIYTIDPTSCEGCGVCTHFCPVKAIDFSERNCGEWYVSQTRYGTMVHAQLGIGAENSGKLVSVVRQKAKSIAGSNPTDLLIVDGPPGIGCPVIASITGSDHVLAVTEPSLSGYHDLERVMQLVQHFKISMSVCINKWDINPELSEQIERLCRESGSLILGRIPYDPSIGKAQCAGQSLIEFTSETPATEAVNQIWNQLCRILN